MVPFRSTDTTHRIGALTLRGTGQDRVGARLRMERALDRADWTPPGLPRSAILVVRQVRLRTGSPPGVEPAPLGRMVSGAVREASATARRPWLHPDAARAPAVLFLDESELAACLVRDWLRGAVADHWWWRGVLGGLDVHQWIHRHVLSRGAVAAAAIALLAQRGDAVRWLAGVPDAEADEAADAVARAYALSMSEPPPTPQAERQRAAPAATVRRGVPATAPEQRGAERWAQSFPEVFHAPLPRRQKRLLAVAVVAVRALSWARSPEFGAALRALPHGGPQSRPPAPDAHTAPEPERRVGPAPTSAPRALGVEARPAPAAMSSSADVPAASRRIPRIRARGRAPLSAAETKASQHRAPARERGEPPDTAEQAPAVSPAAAIARVDAPSRVAALAPSSAASAAPGLDAGPAIGVRTAFGGIFYLLNAALALGLYGDFTAPRGPSLALSPWDWLAWLGHTWFGDEFSGDPVRGELAELAARPRQSRPPAFEAPQAWTVAEVWLSAWGTPPHLHVHATRRRLRVRHPAGFDVFDVRRDRTQPPLRQASVLCGGYALLRDVRLSRLAHAPAASSSRSARQRWLGALGEYLCARLTVALAAGGAADVRALVCRHPARVVATAISVEVHLALADLPLSIRIAGLDRDPGWIPAAGRSVSFHFA
jgi:hypothetical protein